MCGIIAVVRRPSSQTPPGARGVLAKMEEARALAAQVTGDWVATAAALDRLAARLGSVAQLLCGTRGLRSLLDDPGRRQSLDRLATELDGWVERLEARVDAQAGTMPADALEPVNAALVGVKDALWTLRRDRLAAATAVDALAGPDPSGAAVAAFASIEATLAALDRIEVRGRDSAGVHVLVTGHGLDLNDLGIAAELAARADPLFTNGATRTPRGHLAFVYKAASEVGELGDNGRRLRAAIAADELLHRAVTAPQAQAMVLTHTRWASVGLINEANAHPVNSEERAAGSPLTPRSSRYCWASASKPGRSRSRRRSGGPSPSSKGRLRSLPMPRSRPASCCWPCGAAGRGSSSVLPKTCSWSPASRTA